MKWHRSKETRETLIAALVGAVAALLLSPIGQALSFVVNEYLGRPILSVEYVEVVPDEHRIPFSARGVQSLLESEGYRNTLMRNMGSGSDLMLFRGNKTTLTPGEFASLKTSTDRFIQVTDRRLADLRAFHESLAGQTTDAQVREIAARYQATIPQVYSGGQDLRSMRSTLIAMIDSEEKSLSEANDIAKTLLASFATTSSPATGTGKFKVSILNRGSTDGLIRHVGELTVSRSGLELRIKRAGPPDASASALAMAVPVAVMNPAIDTDRSTSVGKVDAHSMSEFWFEVDESATPASTNASLWQLAREAKLTEGEIVLFDQRNNRIVHRFVPVFTANPQSAAVH